MASCANSGYSSPMSALPSAVRAQLGLDDDAVHLNEFEAAPTSIGGSATLAPGQPPTYRFNPKLVLREGEKASAPKLRQMVNELLAGNIDAADFALKQLFAVNPKLGLELYIEMAQFSLPKLKAVAVQVDDRTENPRSYSFAQLQQALQGD